MKIKLEKINLDSYQVRESVDNDWIDELANSLKIDGQWDPILVKTANNGNFDLISGHCRVLAAKKLGWSEIEGNIVDVDNIEAQFLALKTNLVRRNMSEIEEAKVIQKYLTEFGLTQAEIAKKLGKSQAWVSTRLSLVLNVIESVRNDIIKEKITPSHGILISQLPENKQRKFADLIIKQDLTISAARTEMRRFLNDTIFTIGYSGHDIDSFIEVLKQNEISLLVDIRDSSLSSFKPEFSETVLAKSLTNQGITYVHKKEFGVDPYLRDPYIAGAVPHVCFEKLYTYHVKDLVDPLAEKLKNGGNSCLMCQEASPKPVKGQNHSCHRSILAKLLQDTGLFENIKDL